MAALRTYSVKLVSTGVDEPPLSIEAEHIIHKEGMSVFIQYDTERNGVAVAEVPTNAIVHVTSVVNQ